MSRLLKRQEILDVVDTKYTEVPVPEWDHLASDLKKDEHVSVRVRGATALERDVYEQECVTTVTNEDGDTKTVIKSTIRTRVGLVMQCAVDENGKALFSKNDTEALCGKLSGPINRLFNTIMELSGGTASARSKLEKNSGSGQGDGSPSNSPESSSQEA